MLHFRDWLLLMATLSSILTGIILPEYGAPFQPYPIYCLMALLFFSFLPIRLRTILNSVKSSGLYLVYCVFVKLILLPLLVVVSFRYMFPKYAVAALLLSGISSGVSSPFFAVLVQANISLVFAMVVVSSILVPFTLPVLAHILVGKYMEISLFAMSRLLGLVIFCPLILAEILKRFAPDFTAKLSKAQYSVALVSFVVTNVGIFSQCAAFLREEPSTVLISLGVSVILAAGIRIPVGREVTYFLFNHLPFYKGLRESQKWASLVTAIYLIFLSIGLREFFSKKIVQRHVFVLKCFIGAVIVMQAPLLLFGFRGQVAPVNYPSDWYAVNDYIVRDSGCAGNTLFFPWHLYMSFSWLGRIVTNPAPSFFQCPVVSGSDMEWGSIYDNSESPEGRAVEQWLARGGVTDLLQNGAWNIHYVILAKELDWGSYAGMGSNPELKLVIETATLRVYKVTRP